MLNMLRIGTACGSGLGSSFMLEMNIEKVLKDLGVDMSKVDVNHYDMGSATKDAADVWFVGKDLEDAARDLGDVRILNSIIDMDELKERVAQVAQENNLI